MAPWFWVLLDAHAQLGKTTLLSSPLFDREQSQCRGGAGGHGPQHGRDEEVWQDLLEPCQVQVPLQT